MEGDCDVRVYRRHEDGGFELVTTVSIGYLGGSLPNVGDVLALWDRANWLEVVSRHFVVHSQADRGWALIGIPVGRDRKTKLIFDQWGQDTRDFAVFEDEEVVQSALDLDRTNRDPDYWTVERKEILRLEREARVAAIKAAEGATRNRK